MTARALRRCVDPLRLRASRVVAGAPGPVRIAGVPYPAGARSRHTLVCGADGGARHALLSDLVAGLRTRGERCVILDGNGRYTEAFFDSGRDVLLNPLDARAPGWSPFPEARDARGFAALAGALIPRQAHPLQRIRTEAAGRVFARSALRLSRSGARSDRALAKNLRHTVISRELTAFKRTFGRAELDPDDPGHAMAVGAFLSDIAGALEALAFDGRPFSIRDWIRARGGGAGGCLFLSSQGAWAGSLRGLMAAWLQIAVDALRWRGWRNSARVWVIADGIASVNAVPGLRAALAEGPSFGGRVVLGVPAASALRDVYGTREADTIANLCGTRAVLSVGGAAAAMSSAEWLGRTGTGAAATGPHGGAVSSAPNGNARLIVPPDEIRRLGRREGYLKFPGPWPVARFRVRDGTRRRTAPRFVARRPAPSDGPGTGRNGGSGNRQGETGGRSWAPRDRGSPANRAGNGRLNGRDPDRLNWC